MFCVSENFENHIISRALFCRIFGNIEAAKVGRVYEWSCTTQEPNCGAYRQFVAEKTLHSFTWTLAQCSRLRICCPLQTLGALSVQCPYRRNWLDSTRRDYWRDSYCCLNYLPLSFTPYRGGAKVRIPWANARQLQLRREIAIRSLWDFRYAQWLKWFCEAEGGGAHLTKPG